MPGTATEPAAEASLMKPAEVAQLFNVDPKTVARWAQTGRLTCVRTLGGHRRFPRDEVMRALEAGRQDGSA